MRHLLLALMIVLLPLRGWMGDAMATDMAINMATRMSTSTAVTAKTIAASAHKTSATSHFWHETAALTTPIVVAQAHPDCGGHVSGNAAPLAEAHQAHGTSGMHGAQDTQDEHCKSCPSCEACHTLALSPPAPRSVAIFSVKGQPDAAALPFVNAEAALSQKPPIS